MGKGLFTTTEYKLDKTTYLVAASPSEKASETIEDKVKNLIRKDMIEIKNK